MGYVLFPGVWQAYPASLKLACTGAGSSLLMCCYGDLAKVASTNRREGLGPGHTHSWVCIGGDPLTLTWACRVSMSCSEVSSLSLLSFRLASSCALCSCFSCRRWSCVSSWDSLVLTSYTHTHTHNHTGQGMTSAPRERKWGVEGRGG